MHRNKAIMHTKVIDFIFYEAWVKTTQKKPMQQGGLAIVQF
jgi:hypothetical protein